MKNDTMNTRSGIIFISSGDILLVRSKGLLPFGNVLYQTMKRSCSIFRHRKTIEFVPTHVALALDTNIVIHSDLKGFVEPGERNFTYRNLTDLFKAVCRGEFFKHLRNTIGTGSTSAARSFFGHGVHTMPLDEFIKKYPKNNIMLIRHPDLTEPSESGNSLTVRLNAQYYLGQLYNPLINWSSGKGISAFCSQFIYNVFARSRFAIPGRRSEKVLPVDFMLWATESNWLKISGDQVFEAANRYNQFKEESGLVSDLPYDYQVQMHRAVVSHLIEGQNVEQVINEFQKHIVSLQETSVDLQYVPRRLMQSDMDPIPHSVEGALSSADEMYVHLTGDRQFLDKPIHDRNVTFGRFDNVLADFEGKPLSWLLKESTSSTAGNTEVSPSVMISAHFLDTTESIMEDFDNAIDEALLYLKTRQSGIAGQPLWGGDAESDVHNPVEVLAYVSRFFDRTDTLEKIEEQKGLLLERHKQTLKDTTLMLKEYRPVLNEVSQGEQGKDVDQIDAIGQRLQQQLRACLCYAIAADFATYCHVLKVSDQGMSFDNSLKKMLEIGSDEINRIASDSVIPSLRNATMRSRKKIREILSRYI
ncbi:hypothetical protein [Azospirillum brasilense]|uniref:hypothetical protein n=1 Tax=Azospirillum brasilense TaxID=192 RepID=UPI0011F02856|nr:hypothetical protein [Azospirillum brasilense]